MGGWGVQNKLRPSLLTCEHLRFANTRGCYESRPRSLWACVYSCAFSAGFNGLTLLTYVSFGDVRKIGSLGAVFYLSNI